MILGVFVDAWQWLGNGLHLGRAKAVALNELDEWCTELRVEMERVILAAILPVHEGRLLGAPGLRTKFLSKMQE